MKTQKIPSLLASLLCLATFSSLSQADTITLVDSRNSAVSTQITTTTSADGKTIGITFTNQSDPVLKVRILDVLFVCGSCSVPTQRSISFTDPTVDWRGPIDLTGIEFAYSSTAGFNLLNRVPGPTLQELLNAAGPASVASGVTGTISLSFNSAFFPNGFSANALLVDYIYQDANGNWQRGVPVGNANVPEPATLLLLGSGLAALGLKARKRKA